MQIQWQNNITLIIKGKDYRVVINPIIEENSKSIIPIKDNDLTISTNKIIYDNTKGYHISGAGEYSYQGVTVRVRTVQQDSAKSVFNLVSLSAEEMLIGLVIGIKSELQASDLEFLGSPDILIMSMSSSFGSEKSIQLINAVEPRIVIPIYETEAQFQALSSEYGIKVESQAELSLKKADLPFDTVKIQALAPQIK
ncbi:hypothetical protein EBU71_02085 [bacterium]|nr:hypothetical protein [Candidatus Elulimicrobium humile]